ncbi:hypothetical protein O2W20_18975 [Modestobacter sp. VKM Ac-2982]|nr:MULTISPECIES: hypothetical protein [unclassified Modestobacter]MCZ2824765.1 hypothetical protein [Modestobacter sp. VKM Ac-2981]MCZ2854732.1 hypothetical protein [Modestobacter sp. VKM Ac-2982]
MTVLLGAPPDWRGSAPTVVPLTRRRPGVSAGVPAGEGLLAAGAAPGEATADGESRPGERVAEAARPVVEWDDVERRAVRALAEFGLVPPLRHQDASSHGDRHVS